MKAASLKEIKLELSTLHYSKLLELCLHLAKYKKENKELLSYLLFEADNEKGYIKDIKAEIDELFLDVNKTQIYLAKKTIRKILRITNKYIKYSGSKQTEVELRMYYSLKMLKSGLPLQNGSVLGNIYWREVERIKKALSTLHEDLQYDYSEELKMLL